MPELRRPSRPDREQVVAWSVVAAVTAFVAWQLHPSLLLADTTPTQGDLGSHLHEPAYLRDHLLPHGRLSGWTHDWYTGYPSLTFYFPLGSLLVVLLDLLLPYNVAFKTVAAGGPILLPLCAYAFGRLGGERRSTSAVLAAATLPMLLEPSLLIAGGSIGAAAVGEYGYGLSLSVGLVALGLARAGLVDGRRRALTAVVLAATVLLHILPAATVVAGIAIATALRWSKEAAWWAVSVLAAAGALVAFWALPFLLYARFTAGPEYEKTVPVLDHLFPGRMAPMVVLALFAAAWSFVRSPSTRHDLGTFMLAMALLGGVLFASVPTGRVLNERFLPVWFLWLSLLGGLGVVRLAVLVDRLRARRARGAPVDVPELARLAAPLLVFLAVAPLGQTRLGPGLLAGNAPDLSDVPVLAFEGYERSTYARESDDIIDTVRRIAREHGCGRAHWQWDGGFFSDYYMPLLQLIPYWTDGCIPVTEGLFTQSAATSPFVNLANSRLSPEPVVLEYGLPFDFEAGVADLRTLGVRYLMVSHPETITAADRSSSVRLVGETHAQDGFFWRFYEVLDVRLVEPLRFEPVVVGGANRSRVTWEQTTRAWYEAQDVRVAADGPKTWARRSRAGDDLPRRPLPEVSVRDVRVDDDRISFRISRTGVPVVVKVSYFPNWRADGADGPWRVTPNQMVVVPTSEAVTLHYARSPVELGGLALTGAGVVGVALLVRRGPVGMPAPPAPAAPDTRAVRRPTKRRKR